MNNAELFSHFMKQATSLGFTVHKVDWWRGGFDHERELFSMVHFRVKQLKGWFFGIWFMEVEGKPSFTLFTQHDDNIDKFKPTCSTFVYESRFDFTSVKDSLRDYELRVAIDRIMSPLRYDYCCCYFRELWGEYPRNRFTAFINFCYNHSKEMYKVLKERIKYWRM